MLFLLLSGWVNLVMALTLARPDSAPVAVLRLFAPFAFFTYIGVRTFPAPGAGGPSSDTVWWTVLTACAVAIAVSVGGRGLPRLHPAPGVGVGDRGLTG